MITEPCIAEIHRQTHKDTFAKPCLQMSLQRHGHRESSTHRTQKVSCGKDDAIRAIWITACVTTSPTFAVAILDEGEEVQDTRVMKGMVLERGCCCWHACHDAAEASTSSVHVIEENLCLLGCMLLRGQALEKGKATQAVKTTPHTTKFFFLRL